ncbi:hypothetical protein SS50377_23040 [Spironucleus salmonicida]|nr:hypothetical protein SS50377_23040 [Spironucleus salmonicida]
MTKFSLQHQPDLSDVKVYERSPEICFQGSDSFAAKINPELTNIELEFVALSKTHQGSIYIQNVLANDPIQTNTILLPKIMENLYQLCFNEYGNHIIQYVINQFPFIVDYFFNLLSDNQNLLLFAIHQHSSWPLRILLKNNSIPPHLVVQINQNIVQIANSTTGNYVIQHILANPLCPDSIIDSLITNARELVFGKHASHLLEKLIYDDLINFNQILLLIKILLFTGIEQIIFENRYSCFVIEKCILKLFDKKENDRFDDEINLIMSTIKCEIDRSLIKYKNLAEGHDLSLLDTIQIQQIGSNPIRSFLTTLQTSKRKLSAKIKWINDIE